ncbi:MAG: hypothetical protein R2792_08620 [Saprospiraceae bacterium]
MLIEYGFERTDFVYEPGQFSIRGGIIDLFSYGNEKPYRIELFDEEVERIRTFDPLTQLSEQNLSKVTLIPNLNAQFTQDQKASLLEIIPEDTVLWIKTSNFYLTAYSIALNEPSNLQKKSAHWMLLKFRNIS